MIGNYSEVKKSLRNLSARLDLSRSATAPDIRRKNTNIIKGLIQDCFIDTKDKGKVYNSHKTIDIENILRRSEAEVANYELKQGILNLDHERKKGKRIYENILTSLCGIANIGKSNEAGIVGKLIIGVTDSDEDAERIKVMDGIEPKIVGSKKVVGIKREAKVLGISVEDYYENICRKIEKSNLSVPLKDKIMSLVDYNEFYGYGLIVITVPLLKNHSIYDDDIYYRVGSSTKKASAVYAAEIAKKF